MNNLFFPHFCMSPIRENFREDSGRSKFSNQTWLGIRWFLRDIQELSASWVWVLSTVWWWVCKLFQAAFHSCKTVWSMQFCCSFWPLLSSVFHFLLVIWRISRSLVLVFRRLFRITASFLFYSPSLCPSLRWFADHCYVSLSFLQMLHFLFPGHFSVCVFVHSHPHQMQKPLPSETFSCARVSVPLLSSLVFYSSNWLLLHFDFRWIRLSNWIMPEVSESFFVVYFNCKNSRYWCTQWFRSRKYWQESRHEMQFSARACKMSARFYKNFMSTPDFTSGFLAESHISSTPMATYLLTFP